MERNRQKKRLSRYSENDKKITFKVNTGKNVYMMTWNIKRESANLFQNNKTPERYLAKSLSNLQVAKQKECGIWLDD